MGSLFKDKSLQEAYDIEGYANTCMLSSDEVSQFLAELAKLSPEGGFAPSDSANIALPYHVSFLDSNQDYRRGVFNLVSDYFASKVREVLPDYHILNTSLIVKPPRHGLFPVHHDWSFLADHAGKCMTIWCPLIDTNTENGTIHLLPGSNKVIKEIQTPKIPCCFHAFREHIVERWLQPIPTLAGHALLWDNHMIHWSGKNHTDDPRIAVQITCIPVHSQPVYFYYNEQRPYQFELIDADQEFWLRTDHQELFTRQPHWRSLGYVPNENRSLSITEFSELLRKRTGSCRTE